MRVSGSDASTGVMRAMGVPSCRRRSVLFGVTHVTLRQIVDGAFGWMRVAATKICFDLVGSYVSITQVVLMNFAGTFTFTMASVRGGIITFCYNFNKYCLSF